MGHIMANRAREFLNRWEREHVGVVPEERKLRVVVQLVMKCREDAVAAGIPAEELRTAASQDLISRHAGGHCRGKRKNIARQEGRTKPMASIDWTAARLISTHSLHPNVNVFVSSRSAWPGAAWHE